ncbi:hypothetical protein AAGS61_15435 [Lysinibacillus sp. KU-BSD001]|uniref:hypothetical protein n=1 Tax=Lysinibacillus sp. KU-BSD001 TaxID=3141328 RepID=UPI0036E3C75E
MKLVLKAACISLSVHIIYCVITVSWGYIQTLFYTPNFSDTNVFILQNEVVFAYVASPLSLLISFMIILLVSWLILKLAQTKQVID